MKSNLKVNKKKYPTRLQIDMCKRITLKSRSYATKMRVYKLEEDLQEIMSK